MIYYKVSVPGLLLITITCLHAMQQSTPPEPTTPSIPIAANPIVPIHIMSHFNTLEYDNGALKIFLAALVSNQEACHDVQPKIIIMNSTIAYAVLIDGYQHFTELGYKIPPKKRAKAPIAESIALNKKKGFDNIFYGTQLFSADLYLTTAYGEKFLIAVFSQKSFKVADILKVDHLRKINLPTQFTVISTQEQDELMETIEDLYDAIIMPPLKRLATSTVNFAHIFNPTTSYTLRFFLEGHGCILNDTPLEFQKSSIYGTVGMPGANFAQMLTVINSLPSVDFVLWITCSAGGFNAKRVADYLTRTCKNRKFSAALFPPFERVIPATTATLKDDAMYSATKNSLRDATNTHYRTVAYLAPDAQEFKLLSKNKESLLLELAATARESKERGLSQESFELLLNYEKEHNCELISPLAHEAAKNNNAVLFYQIIHNFSIRITPELFIECMRLFAEQDNLTEVKLFLEGYTGQISKEQRATLLDLAQRNDSKKISS